MLFRSVPALAATVCACERGGMDGRYWQLACVSVVARGNDSNPVDLTADGRVLIDKARIEC